MLCNERALIQYNILNFASQNCNCSTIRSNGCYYERNTDFENVRMTFVFHRWTARMNPNTEYWYNFSFSELVVVHRISTVVASYSFHVIRRRSLAWYLNRQYANIINVIFRAARAPPSKILYFRNWFTY